MYLYITENRISRYWSRRNSEWPIISEYIALEKQSPENAKGQTDRIWEALKSLDTFQQSHQERTEGRYAGKFSGRQM
jgi:hypothetical protein